MKNFGIYCGRFNPIHAGHVAVIKKMINEVGPENCLIVIGSSNAPFSLRHFFSYRERRDMVKKLFPKTKIVGLPDFNNDSDWLLALDDLIVAAGLDPKKAIYYGGCKEDILYFFKDKRKCEIINRFDGSTPKISATEIRDNLIYNRPIDQFIDPKIVPMVTELFKKKWELFKKM